MFLKKALGRRLFACLITCSMLAATVGAVRGQNLVVDANNGNSPTDLNNVLASYLSLTSGQTSTGVVNHSGGSSVSLAQTLVVGAQPGSDGSYNLQSGTLNVGLTAVIGDEGQGLLNQTGGDLNIGNTLVLGAEVTGAGAYLLQDGTLATGNLVIGGLGSGGLFISGGTATVTGTLNLTTGATGSGVLQISGGTLVTTSLIGGPGQSEFEIGDGMLRIIAPSANFGGGLDEFALGGSPGAGPIIDTNGQDVTINQPLVSGVSAVLTDGGLTKRGGGVLTLSAVNTYTGDTIVEGGELRLNASRIGVGGREANLIARDGGAFRAENGSVVQTLTTTIGSASGGRYFLDGSEHNNLGDFVLAPDAGGGGRVNLLNNPGELNTDRLIVGQNGNGLFEHFGGTPVTTDIVILGENVGSRGEYSHGPGRLNVNDIIVGREGEGQFNRGNNSGRFTDGANLTLGQSATGDGIWRAAKDEKFGNLIVGDAGTGFFRHTLLGTDVTTESLIIGRSGHGRYRQTTGDLLANGGIMLAEQAGSSGELDLSGSADLATRFIRGGDGDGRVYFDGATVTTADGAELDFISGLAYVGIGDRGLRLNPTRRIIVNQDLEHSDKPGADAKDGGVWFQVVNARGVEFAGQNSYTGDTLLLTKVRFVLSGAIGLGATQGDFLADFDDMRVTLKPGSQLITNRTTFRSAVLRNTADQQFFRQEGGTHEIRGGEGLILGGDTFLSIPLPDEYDYEATYELNGGVLITPQVRADDSVRDSLNRFEFNGGTLQLNADQNQLFLGIDQLQIRDGGATIDTAGFDTTLATILEHSDISGDAPIDGGLTKLGAGVLQTTQANTYTGQTTISDGTFLANNTTGSATGSGTVLIDGGTLAGQGVIATDNYIHLTSGTIAPGNSPGTLTFDLPDPAPLDGRLFLDGGTLQFELGDPGNPLESDLITFTNLAAPLLGSRTTLQLLLNAGFDYEATYTLFQNVLDSGSGFAFADVTGLDPAWEAVVFHNDDLNAYQIRFIPEPGSLALLGLALASAATRRRRSRPIGRFD